MLSGKYVECICGMTAVTKVWVPFGKGESC